jgi:4-nitrophenyl phosphatase
VTAGAAPVEDPRARKPWPDIAAAIFDLDGTVYRGDDAIPGAVEALRALRDHGVKVGFVTNNATQRRVDFARKLTRLGFPTDEWSVVTSAYVAADLLSQRYPAGTAVYVVGAPALVAEVERAGFAVTEEHPEVVVVGLDRSFTYAKLRTGVRAILGGADFIATNSDRLLPVGADFDPGAGTLVAAFRAATPEVVMPVVVGKPEPRIVDIALRKLGVARENTVLVGDQLDTDVRAGQAAGVFSVLVTTGVPLRRGSDVVPDRVIEGLSQIPLPAQRRAG